MQAARSARRFAAIGAVVLVGAGTANAASPRQIWQDYVQHGKLTHNYSKADLQRALQSAVFRAYHHGHKTGLSANIQTKIKPPKKSGGGLPFTGMDLGLISFGALLLLGFGASFRRIGRVRM